MTPRRFKSEVDPFRSTEPKKEVRGLAQVTARGVLTLPASIRRAANIQEGDILEISVHGDELRVVPKRLIDKSQAYFWTSEWQEGEFEAEADIEEGRVKTFESVEELLSELRK